HHLVTAINGGFQCHTIPSSSLHWVCITSLFMSIATETLWWSNFLPTHDMDCLRMKPTTEIWRTSPCYARLSNRSKTVDIQKPARFPNVESGPVLCDGHS